MTGSELTKELAPQYRQRIPLERFSAPEEQANVLVFLAPSEASFVNGTTLEVDDGQRAGFWYLPASKPGPDRRAART